MRTRNLFRGMKIRKINFDLDSLIDIKSLVLINNENRSDGWK